MLHVRIPSRDPDARRFILGSSNTGRYVAVVTWLLVLKSCGLGCNPLIQQMSADETLTLPNWRASTCTGPPTWALQSLSGAFILLIFAVS